MTTATLPVITRESWPSHPAARLISCIFAPADQILLRPVESWTEGGQKKTRPIYKHTGYSVAASYLFRTQFEKLLTVAEEESANLFYGVSPRFGVGGFDKKWQIRIVRCLWADIDGCRPDEAAARCTASGVPAPTAIVSSGNGTHLYWKLAEPYRIDDAPAPPRVFAEWIDQPGKDKKVKREWYEDSGTTAAKPETPETKERLYLPADAPPLSEKATRIEDVLTGIAAAIDGDHTQDLSRLLRLPATLNRKDQRNGRPPTLCDLVSIEPDRSYSLMDFERFAEHSLSRKKRVAVKTVPLPTPRKRISPTKQDRLNDLIAVCAITEAGDRSERDFDFCCYCLRSGIAPAAAWPLVQGIGKFAEKGEDYFWRTWAKAENQVREQIYRKLEKKVARKAGSTPSPSVAHANGNGNKNGSSGNNSSGNGNPPQADAYSAPADEPQEKPEFSNYTAEFDDEGKPTRVPKTMVQCCSSLWEIADGWPRRVDNLLFIEEPAADVAWLKDAPSLFGWVASKVGNIQWGQGEGFVNRDEMFAETRRTALAYDSIEYLPHFPAFKKHYYLGKTPEPGDGSKLRELLSRFAPSTPVDGDLLLAAVATIFWGGAGGCRPAFIITSDSGRGAGKTKLVEMIGHIAGGLLDFSTKDDISAIKTRLLSTEGMARRMALLDNIKSLRFSWAELEALVTAATINGHRMYAGDASRPNLITWFLTLNGASLSTDVAQRAVIIKLDRPERSGDWEEATREFILVNRTAIIADVAAFFLSDPFKLTKFSRWASWEAAVLSRLADPAEAQAVILERQQVADTEKDDHEQMEDYFAERLKSLGYDPDRSRVFIATEICCRWFNWAQNSNLRTRDVTTIINNATDQDILKRFQKCGRSYGRGFMWVGKEATSNTHFHTDLKDRISEKSGQSEKNQSEFQFGGF